LIAKLGFRLETATIDVPTLMITATKDIILTPALSRNMEKYLPRLSRGEVQANHWALTQKGDEVNKIVKEWLEREVLELRSSL
jgi:soluble epoxide hydrolase / lipid-phosphate phosphatase